MKRYPAFDPPEYVQWSADPQLVEAFAQTLERDPARARVVADLTPTDLRSIYRDLLRTRLHDIGLKRWVRTGVISKAWLGTGEEAVTVGTVRALDPTCDIVCPMIRNAGALHMMGMPLADMFRGYLATSDSPSAGRDLHIGDLEAGIIQPISHMGTSVTVVAGVALAFRNRGEARVAMTWVGDGAIKTAACHEGMNLAAVQNVPAIFVIQNNRVALGTPLETHGAGDLHAWPAMYGIDSWVCDGNNVLDVYAAAHLAAERCRSGQGPAAIVADTFRMGGHATHDEREARETFADELFAAWGKRDPIGLFEAYLGTQGVGDDDLAMVEEEVTLEMDRAANEALESRHLIPPPEQALYEGFSEGNTLVGLTNRPI
ncbi:MAG: thiamine pyrophosphate-dependent dehydrogenase E1 component subunit alpha [Gemmatimonadetes bacterium]|nr:thiamine pyrophosphate-dependent dehydrogenase E1 component subunit alpha [Gemmatimonadota bacterium]MDA1102537.1 thiamine pyrophosphate-dependent dehydrogenase E1 component subunit alpha [Gemmatimonadota bacterium]